MLLCDVQAAKEQQGQLESGLRSVAEKVQDMEAGQQV